MKFWPECRLVNSRPRHPQSQGSVERANGDIESMLRAWMHNNNSKHWAVGCKVVQWKKNTLLHGTINRTPYSALFCKDPPVEFHKETLDDEEDNPDGGNIQIYSMNYF